jgi:hypothetical protein
MKFKLALIACLLIPISLFASEYAISPGTRDNSITLDVSNTSGETLQKLMISVTQKPSWVTVTSIVYRQSPPDSIELKHNGWLE